MLFIKSLKNEGVTYLLLVDEEYSVGRKNASVLIADDPSISRQHAVLRASHSLVDVNNAEKLPILTVKDCGSKYGTFINNRRIGSEAVILKIGDKITFGQCDSSYQVCYQPLVISTSCIDSQEKRLLRDTIVKLGGHIVSEWQRNCTHLAMKEVKITIKAVCAMVSLKPIVTGEFFKDLFTSIQEQKSPPNPKCYIPKSGEQLITDGSVSFDCKPERATIFQKKEFICMTEKQYKKIHLAITLGSGTVKLLNEDREIKASVLLNPDTIVMRYQSESGSVLSQVPMHVRNVEQELKRNGKRAIPESDLGLAVVYCSTERYCNPSYNMVSTLFSMNNLHSQTLSQGNVFAEETQVSTQSSAESRTRLCVEESLERSRKSTIQNSLENPSTSRKRNRDDNEGQCESLTKLVKLESGAETEFESTIPVVPDSIKLETRQDDEEQEVKVLSLSPNSTQKTCPLLNEPESIDAPTEPWPDHSDSEHLDGFLMKPKKKVSTCIKTKVEQPENKHQDEELPSKLVKVEFASLCVPRQSVCRPEEPNTTVRNFKRFRKVFSTANRLPCIIGGRDLVAYDRNSSKLMDEWLSQNPEPQQEDDAGLFDWRPNSSRRRKR